ncbi:MAG: hypothetical protein IT431_01785 [Phycisphaerales bacterium]|nr:hypothetical protein [Phycisphaerales bacterium]
MGNPDQPLDSILASLKERAKELACLYRIDELVGNAGALDADVFEQVVRAIPPGWQFPGICEARLTVGLDRYSTDRFNRAVATMSSPVEVENEPVGTVAVAYTEPCPESDEGPFLKEERRLIDAVAQRIGHAILRARILTTGPHLGGAPGAGDTPPHSWEVLIDFLRRTDRELLGRINRRMANHLCWSGVPSASDLLGHVPMSQGPENGDENRPAQRRRFSSEDELTRRTFALAAEHLNDTEIIACIQTWLNEEKSLFLIQTLENPDSGLAETAEALKRFRSSGVVEGDLPAAMQTTLRVALVRRYFVDQPEFINIAKDHIAISDLYEVVDRLVHPTASHGKIGGKGAGLVLAHRILRDNAGSSGLLADLRVPKTWYVASDGLLAFIHYNNLEEVYNHKYMEIERVRQEYPHIIQVFKNSQFPPEMRKGLSAALDDLPPGPIIVRSSSLLEDRSGASFAGKYKSLFLANQGTKAERLAALEDAIAEIYASVFGPDPIEYRIERGLLHFSEEMGILIQEVVGRRAGDYFFPSFAGVAFSSNEFRWSPRIKREDGLIRMVPGLGTRAVDRTGDDYPVLVSPGQPTLRVSTSARDIVRYAPRKVDVIDLERRAFSTVEAATLLRGCGDDYPGARRLISIVQPDHVSLPSALGPNWETDDFVITFEGVLSQTPFMKQMREMLGVLREGLGTDVDIEFAHDGEHLYLVQCRAQSRSTEYAPAAIPRDIPHNRLLFSASRHISNGRVPNITHIVYVDPEAYANLGSYRELKDVAHAVGRLNSLLPKRQFILLGPGRWGSRGDIKLGVSVTYSDISNAAMLLEIARASGSYVPELSFGTHFFQDMVEAGIRYLPLYPDEPPGMLNETFLKSSRNILPSLVPEHQDLGATVRVIDVQAETGGNILRVLMNADLEEAVGFLARPERDETSVQEAAWIETGSQEEHWRWRLQMAERIAARIDAPAFGIKQLYLIGSVKNATAGPGSDIDLLVHDAGDAEQRSRLRLWLDGVSLALAEINYLRTGYETEGLLDPHYVTDEDIANKTSFAAKIGAVTDAARRLTLGRNSALDPPARPGPA